MSRTQIVKSFRRSQSPLSSYIYIYNNLWVQKPKKMDFQRISDNPLAKYLIFNEFHECTKHISSYLSQSKHSRLVLQTTFFKKITLWCLFMDGVNSLKDAEPIRGDSSLFTSESPGGPGTHFINLERMKVELT